jgi:uncharacterized protein YutE (UPF0331/DUF86 family)
LTFEEFAANPEKTWAVEHGLQISIQIILDVGNQLLAQRGENNLDDYTDVIIRLGNAGILPKQFAQRIKQMAGFRNILVHEYTEIDLKEVYRVLQENLSDFETFGKYVEAYLAADRS